MPLFCCGKLFLMVLLQQLKSHSCLLLCYCCNLLSFTQLNLQHLNPACMLIALILQLLDPVVQSPGPFLKLGGSSCQLRDLLLLRGALVLQRCEL